MLGKNLLWVAKQHGHSVEVMLRMYASWLDGATDSDIHAMKEAMERRPIARTTMPNARAAISTVNAGTNYPRLIVIRPPESPEFGSSLAVGKSPSDLSLRNDSQKKWRRGWDCSRLRRSSLTCVRDRRRKVAPASCADARVGLSNLKVRTPPFRSAPRIKKGHEAPS
jgi:hypothetical protein